MSAASPQLIAKATTISSELNFIYADIYDCCPSAANKAPPINTRRTHHSMRGNWSRRTRAGTSSTAPRGSVPSWNGP